MSLLRAVKQIHKYIWPWPLIPRSMKDEFVLQAIKLLLSIFDLDLWLKGHSSDLELWLFRNFICFLPADFFIMPPLILFCTVCQCPINLGLYGLNKSVKPFWKTYFICWKQNLTISLFLNYNNDQLMFSELCCVLWSRALKTVKKVILLSTLFYKQRYLKCILCIDVPWPLSNDL